MYKHLPGLLLVALPALVAQTPELSSTDRQFLMNAAQDGMVEVELGEAAQQRASSPEVKSFAQQIVEEHSKVNEKLKSIASARNVTLPPDLQAKHRTQVDLLLKLSGEQFDKAYMRHMVENHRKAVGLFERASKNARDEEIKGFASSTLPTLKEHLKMAQSLNATPSGTASREKKSSATDTTGLVDKKGAEDRKKP